MFISLQQLELRPVRFNIDIPAGEIEYDGKISQASALHVEGEARLLNRTLGEVRIQGDLSVTIVTPCDRCLENTSFPVSDHFDLLYVPARNQVAPGEEEIDEAAIEVGYYEGNGLSLKDVLREVVLLSLPMQLVCSEDCKGICPVCGQNRNQSDCGCRVEAVDDRWNKLKQFRAQVGPQN